MEDKKNKIPVFIMIILGAAVFLYIGFVVASCMVPQQNDITFIRLFANAKANQYTPIVMALAFVIYESLIFFTVVWKNVKSAKQSRDMEEPPLILEKGEEKIMEQKLVEQALTEPDPPSTENKTEVPVDDDVFMDEKLFSELYACDYSFEQITEMMKLGKYMKDLTCETLMKMFSVEKTPDEIRQYIDMFYG